MNRHHRIKRIDTAFQEVNRLLQSGHVVLWDDDAVTRIEWYNGVELRLWHNNQIHTSIYNNSEVFEDLADLTIAEINKELSDRLSVLKKIDIEV